jgi:PPK2 family polyphosphate:nucleotide phosphotransferase
MKLEKAIAKMLVPPGKKIKLKDYKSDFKPKDKSITREEADKMREEGLVHMRQMQDMLMAEQKHSVLLVIQAMDAAGKDSAVNHVMSGLNPVNVKVVGFKAPTHLELGHDYLWRHQLVLPSRGEIGIFVRSHYENVLVTRVHPEYLLAENIPGIERVEDVTPALFKTRFRQINDWERHLSENGMRIIKVFLYQSKEEQKKQFLERIDDPAKNWKFNTGDLKDRAAWDKFMAAYEDMLNHTSTEWAPWYILPADDRWFARISLAAIAYREFSKMKLKYPTVSEADKAKLQEAREILMSEEM